MTYIATSLHQNPCPGGHEIYNLGRLFLDHQYFILSLTDLAMGEDFKEIMHLH